MEKLTKLVAQPRVIWFFAGLGDALLVVGIVTAAINATFAGFTPIIWFVLALVCYLHMIWVVTMRIVARLESKAQS